MSPPAGVWHVHHCAPLFFPSPHLPARCPACGKPLPTSPPREVPSPFRRAADQPRSVLIRPTEGDFLLNYTGGGDLHAGVTDSGGGVVAFDRAGLRRVPTADWPQCIVIPLPASDAPAEAAAARWDHALDRLLTADAGRPLTTDEADRNCFSFVLAFLAALGLPGVAAGGLTREAFAREHVVPVSGRAAKYLTLYRRVRRLGWYAIGEEGRSRVQGAVSGGEDGR
ncbi:LOW QUALITY PROTEIN: MKRN2 opposite strand protein-like [Pollicipes pollicipes]|uniref:LOW QUALITY PROTEIN: MKRN2 opposite strand protein-like n=1 Tax=Pollicipes pollicipes TaxID=41117 RepID=UPI0018854A1B|nr:LOW QUALITY PROTEIN: MKRN2 opposite strand protein-like [Pollicipes pollicipes]